MTTRNISITESDLARLRALISKESSKTSSERLARLGAELERATIVSARDVPPDVVTMHSTVELLDLETGQTEILTLVFPDEADIDHHKISVLAPMGTATLGYRVGDEFEWQVPAGIRRMRVNRILYQPEAAEDWDL